ncbi:MAG: MBL fold metallo-hydrolase [Rhodothermales bacterium]
MLFVPLGKTEAIGANCHFMLIEGTGLVIDAGADPEEDGPESVPDFGRITSRSDWYVDHALITHAHHDHIGSLPVLMRRFPHVLVHMTRATRDLAEFVLPASARLQERKLREGSSIYEPLFGEDELGVYSYLYLTHDLEKDFDVTGVRGGTPVTARFYHAGHILGAAGVFLTFEEDGRRRRIFYTSDTSSHPQSIIPGGDYPAPPIDVLFLESTLGADPEAELTTRQAEERKLADGLARVVARGGTALIPVFALGRAQEILALIHRFKKRGRIPDDVPVYTAGSMRAFSELYDKTRHHSPRLNPDFQVYDVEQSRLPRNPSALRGALEGPAIHVVASGMMFERTNSNRLAQKLVEDETHAVFLVGFSREDSPAGRLLAAAEEGPGTEVVLDPEKGPQPVRCEVHRLRFSGHSHRRELLQLVDRLKPATVALVHGEAAAKRWMAENIRFFYPDVHVVIPETGEATEL